jgi:hypothetical protein
MQDSHIYMTDHADEQRVRFRTKRHHHQFKGVRGRGLQATRLTIEGLIKGRSPSTSVEPPESSSSESSGPVFRGMLDPVKKRSGISKLARKSCGLRFKEQPELISLGNHTVDGFEKP